MHSKHARSHLSWPERHKSLMHRYVIDTFLLSTKIYVWVLFPLYSFIARLSKYLQETTVRVSCLTLDYRFKLWKPIDSRLPLLFTTLGYRVYRRMKVYIFVLVFLAIKTSFENSWLFWDSTRGGFLGLAGSTVFIDGAMDAIFDLAIFWLLNPIGSALFTNTYKIYVAALLQMRIELYS